MNIRPSFLKPLKSPRLLLFRACASLWLFCGALAVPTAHALSCGDNVAGTVVLTSNLNCNTGYVALEVVNHNTTIDLNGFTISGSRGLSGINVGEYHNLVVKNGALRGFWAGVNSTRSDNLLVDNVTFNEVGHGVIISAGNKARIQNNDFIKTSSNAIYINVRDRRFTANKNIINNNEFYQIPGAVSICGEQADYNIIANNLIWKSTDYAIHLNHSDRNRVYRNRVLETGDFSALRVANSSYNLVNDNSFQDGDHVGISVLGNAGGACLESTYLNSVKNRFEGNRVSGFTAGFSMGLGLGTSETVIGNGLLNNRITDNDTGIYSRSDTRHNYGRDNNFSGTITPVIDLGVNNRY